MSQVRVAVIGAGYWGPNLVRNFSATPGLEVAYLCDLDEGRLADASRKFRISKTTTRYEDVLEDPSVDAVALATPVATHRILGERALNAKKHLWVEKPLAGSMADAEALLAAAERHGKKLLVDHTFVYTPAIQKIRELIASGELGEILYFDSVRVNLGLFQSDTNVLWDLGPHDLSIEQYVLGVKPKEVSAVGVRHIDGAHENMVYVTLRHEGSLISHFHFNWLAPVKVRFTMIGGSKRMIVYDDLEPFEKIKIYDKGVDTKTDVEARRRTLVSYRTGDMWSPRLDQTEALAVAARDFVGAIRDNRAPASDGQFGVDIVRALSAAQHSMNENGRFVRV